MNVTKRILQIITGIIFICSGFLKLYPVEPFELYIFSQGFINWDLSCFLARFIISTEVAIGVLLILNIFPKQIIKTTCVLLCCFTLFIVYQIIIGNDEDCHCFGEYISLNHWQSIAKNLILIALLLFVYKKKIKYRFKYGVLILVIVLLASVSTIFILNPPDQFLVDTNHFSNTAGTINFEDLEEFNYNEKVIKITKSNPEQKILCFFSPTCKYCRLAAKKMNVIVKNNNLPLNVFAVFPEGSEEYLSDFFKETNSGNIPYSFLPVSDFFRIAGTSVPSIYFIKSDSVVLHTGYRNLFEEDVVNFFNNN
ncbi:MAG: protein tlpB [Marinilabiliales bacterium]